MICMVEFSYQRGFQQFQFRQAYEEIGSEFMEDLLKFFGRVCLALFNGMVYAVGADKDLQGWQHLFSFVWGLIIE